MKIVKDLGTRKDDSGYSRRWVLAECSCCFDNVEMLSYTAKNSKGTKCRECVITNKCGKRRSRGNGKQITRTVDGKQKRLYTIWIGMKGRCYNENNTAYKYYGAKGVTVCDEWLNDFARFEKWALKNGYEDHLTIDKDIKAKDLGVMPIYCPKHCQWITQEENTRFGVSKI